jgi:hypothetical protein
MDSSPLAAAGLSSETRSTSSRGAGSFFSASRGRNMVSSIASGRQSGARHLDGSLWALEERGFVMRQSPSTTRHFQAGKPSFRGHMFAELRPIAQLPFPRRPQYRDLVRMGVTLLSQCSRLFSQAQFGEQKVVPYSHQRFPHLRPSPVGMGSVSESLLACSWRPALSYHVKKRIFEALAPMCGTGAAGTCF